MTKIDLSGENAGKIEGPVLVDGAALADVRWVILPNGRFGIFGKGEPIVTRETKEQAVLYIRRYML